MLVLTGFSLNAEPSQDWQSALVAAQKAIATGNKPLAHKLYLQQADKDNPLAQFTLGWHAKTGWLDGEADRERACQWFIRSSKQKIPVAVQETGHCFRDGILPSETPLKDAIKYYQLAQQVGIFAAACDTLNIEVTLLKQRPPSSLGLCESAAAQNALYAQEILIELYANKQALDDNQRALYWLQRAAPKSPTSAYRYALTLSQSDNIASERIIYWFEASASKGYLPAYLDTALRYYKKIPDAQDPQAASAYLAKAYMWSQAWLARKPNDAKEPQWLAMIAQETPLAWHSELEEKIVEHLALFSD